MSTWKYVSSPIPAGPASACGPREGQRPLLPQHARHCPVLEAGSALGFLVYPPLEPNEVVSHRVRGRGTVQFVYFLTQPGGKWDAIFPVAFVLPVGGIGDDQGRGGVQ